MQDGGVIPWDEYKPILHYFTCPCCMGVRLLPTGEELEERINDQMDRERVKDKALALEIETMKKAVEKVENISGI